MAVTDEDRRAYITENVAADLQYVLEDTGISLDLQYRLTQHYNTLRVFAAIGDTSADVRTALQTDFTLDPACFSSQSGYISQISVSLVPRKGLSKQRKGFVCGNEDPWSAKDPSTQREAGDGESCGEGLWTAARFGDSSQ